MFSPIRPRTINCGALLFARCQTPGQLQIPDSIALDIGTVSMTASGAIDLKTEALDIAFRTDPKKGLKISAGQEIAKLFRLTGTLRSPSLGVDITGAAGSAISWGGAVATAGISLLAERLYKAATDIEDVCKHALTQAPVSGDQSVLQQLTDQPVRSIVKGTGTVVEKTVEGTGSVLKETGKTNGTGVENIGKGISRGLKSLFGTSKSD